MSSDDLATPGAGGVVRNAQGEVLLLKHKSGSWVFPKGHIDPGETALEAALREVEEEAGVVAVCPDENETFRTRYHNDKGELREITYFALRTEAQAPVLREALFQQGGFFSPERALAQLSFEEDKEMLEAFLSSGNERGDADL